MLTAHASSEHPAEAHGRPFVVGDLASALACGRALRGRADELSLAFRDSLIPTLLVDDDLRYVTANRAARLLLRVTLAELRQLHAGELTGRTPGWRSEACDRLQRDGSVTSRNVLHFSDGSSLEIIYSVLPNVLPGHHLVVFVPAEWAPDELGLTHTAALGSVAPPISPREREILALVAAGATTSEIANALTIAPTTVRTHVENARRKLGARNRTHAIALALRLGLIAP